MGRPPQWRLRRGIPYSRLPVASFQEWADYCTEKGYHCNIYFDSIVNMRKALDMVGAVGEGAVAQMGSRFACYVDGEVDLHGPIVHIRGCQHHTGYLYGELSAQR